ncbi:hypothetical protein HALA3H3_320046 [Halomonas sp. A3H3]|nr:hypothetical protein HALA3H3_320046 [Halomonas sp. A3H3]
MSSLKGYVYSTNVLKKRYLRAGGNTSCDHYTSAIGSLLGREFWLQPGC